MTVQRLQEECQWLTVVEYVRALMQKKLICRSDEERQLLAQQMVQDAQQLREHFQSMVRMHKAYCIKMVCKLEHIRWHRNRHSLLYITDPALMNRILKSKVITPNLFDYVRY